MPFGNVGGGKVGLQEGRGTLGVITQLSLDRFEGRHKETAVLVTDDGQQIDFPRSLLPAEAKPGDVLMLSLERDQAATDRLTTETRELQDRLGKTDTGGDIKL